MEVGEVVTIGEVCVGRIVTISVWVDLTCKVNVATELPGFWSVIEVGKLNLPGRLQAARAATTKRDIERDLNVFNFSFRNAKKIIRYIPIYTRLPNRTIGIGHF